MSCSVVKLGQHEPALHMSGCLMGCVQTVCLGLLCTLSLQVIWLHWALRPPPVTVLIHMCQRGGGGGENEKLSVLNVYRLYQVGRFLSTWRCRVLSGGNNTFECSAEWATIAVVCKQCGPGLGSGHRTQLPRLQPPAPVSRALRLYLWHACHSHKFIHPQWAFKHFKGKCFKCFKWLSSSVGPI